MSRTPWLIFACCALLARPLAGQRQVVHWDRAMLEEFGAIADTAHVEHFRCLLGGWRGDTLDVLMAYEPTIVAARATILSPGPCPPLLTIGTWHNHIPRTTTQMGENLGQTKALAEYCKLSLEDRTADAALLRKLISVTHDASCAWALDESGKYQPMEHWPPTPQLPAPTAANPSWR